MIEGTNTIVTASRPLFLDKPEILLFFLSRVEG